jgi:hypothetical protein
MRVFTCTSCGQLVFFDNDTCLRCQAPLGYVAETANVVALIKIDTNRYVDASDPDSAWQRCATHELTGCNWLVAPGEQVLCSSCSLTRTRPNDDDAEGIEEFVAAEKAKRRLLFQLGQLNLPITPRDETKQQGLAFDLLSSTETKVITGHDDGVITLDLAEADDEHREQLRRHLNEPYRTVLGHFRHEIGHYYWPILVHEGTMLDACRALFGDDRVDYAEAVQKHYATDASGADWTQDHISSYATMHPYEDWAESFAHYLHILDTLQTAANFDLVGRSAAPIDPESARPPGTFGEVIDQWLELSYGLNQVNQSMGRGDLYPFVLTPPVIRKLSFVDHVVRAHQAAA